VYRPWNSEEIHTVYTLDTYNVGRATTWYNQWVDKTEDNSKMIEKLYCRVNSNSKSFHRNDVRLN